MQHSLGRVGPTYGAASHRDSFCTTGLFTSSLLPCWHDRNHHVGHSQHLLCRPRYVSVPWSSYGMLASRAKVLLQLRMLRRGAVPKRAVGNKSNLPCLFTGCEGEQSIYWPGLCSALSFPLFPNSATAKRPHLEELRTDGPGALQVHVFVLKPRAYYRILWPNLKSS